MNPSPWVWVSILACSADISIAIWRPDLRGGALFLLGIAFGAYATWFVERIKERMTPWRIRLPAIRGEIER